MQFHDDSAQQQLSEKPAAKKKVISNEKKITMNK